jgi:hypothetical protein
LAKERVWDFEIYSSGLLERPESVKLPQRLLDQKNAAFRNRVMGSAMPPAMH